MRRRTFFLSGAAVAGALIVGWSIVPPRQRLTTARPLPLRPGETALNGWVKVGADDRIVVMMCKSEMGQGVYTGLAMLLAEEMDADWSRIEIEQSPLDKIYNNVVTVVDGLPFHPDDTGTVATAARWLTAKAMREVGIMVTGGSSSIKDLWLPMREAGAAARAMLVEAAAARWGVPSAECRTDAGIVSHPSGHRATYGQLAEAAARRELPRRLVLKDPANFKLVGQSLPRIEARSKLDGTARFGIDVTLPDLHYAGVLMCPTLGGRVTRFAADSVAALRGVRKVIAVDARRGGTGAVAVIADRPFRALRAVQQVQVHWDHGPAAGISSEEVHRRLAKALDEDDGFAFYRRGDVRAALKSAAKTIRAEYRAPYLAHATMEPINCTVWFKDGKATVWASTQVPGLARDAVADVLGIDRDRVEVHVQLLGGGFGRRLEVDHIAQAAAIAREAGGVPVQTLWSREQDITHDFYRPACVARFEAGLDASGRLVAWHNVSASQAIVPRVMERAFGLPGVGPDKTAAEGAFDQAYEWPDARIAHVHVELPIPVGFWRSVGHSHQAFFKECFLDEVAAAAGRDPLAFRAALLQRHPRHLAVLQRAAELAAWDRPLAPAADGARRARGVALHQSFGAVVAQVAEVSLTPERRIRVHRVLCVIDCGLPVNPNLIKQQIESGVVFGLSAALYGEIRIVNGQVQQSNFHDYPLLRFDECPAIEVEIMPSRAHPEGVGEVATPPVAAAVANALFALTGKRLRTLPLRAA